jgi:chromosome segregation and condensation protein ScpB
MDTFKKRSRHGGINPRFSRQSRKTLKHTLSAPAYRNPVTSKKFNGLRVEDAKESNKINLKGKGGSIRKNPDRENPGNPPGRANYLFSIFP